MAKLTIEIDMEDPQEVWDALYRRIETFDDDADGDKPKPAPPTSIPVTYDLLLDPERTFGHASEFLALFTTTHD